MHLFKRLFKRAALVGVAAAFVCLSAGLALAGMGVSPLKQEITVKPGQKGTFHISVSNTVRSPRAKAVTLSLKVVDFRVFPGGGISFVEAGTTERSASKWIKLSRKSVVLKPGKGEKISFTVSVPLGAAGEYYSAVLVTQKETTKTKIGANIRFRIASGIFLTVPGRAFPKLAEVLGCSATPEVELRDGESKENGDKPEAPAKAEKKSSPNPCLKIAATIRNKGRVRFEASGEARIIGSDKRIVARIPLKTARNRVLPGDTRIFEGKLEEPLAAGEYELKVIFDYGSKWAKARKSTAFAITPEVAQAWAAQARKVSTDSGAKALALTAKPDSVTEKVAPGASRRLGIEITNPTGKALSIEAKLLPEGGKDVPDWISVGPKLFVVGAGQKRTVQLIARPPMNAEGKYKLRAVFLPGSSPGEKSEVQAVSVPVELSIREEQEK